MLRIVDQPEYSPQELKERIDLRALIAPGMAIRGDKPVKIRCLWHEEKNPSLTVWSDRLKCFGCNTSMDLLEYVAWREGLDDFGKILEITAEKYVGFVAPPPSLSVPSRAREPLAPLPTEVAEYMYRRLGARREWFHARGLTDETIDREMLGYDRRAFSIPVWSETGELLTLRFRRDDDVLGDEAEMYSKYWGMTGRNEVLLYNPMALALVADWGWVVITEGELDALRLYQEGLPAVSATNGAGAFDESLVSQVEKVRPAKVVVGYDQDERGRVNGIRVARMFGRRGRVARWPREWGKDPTDVLKHRPIDDLVVCFMKAQWPTSLEKAWHDTLRNGVWR